MNASFCTLQNSNAHKGYYPPVKLIFATALLFTGVYSTNLRAEDNINKWDESIKTNRKGALIIETLPGAFVQIEQQQHEFWFGAALASQVFENRMRPEDREKYLTTFLTNFNAAVTENALKWHSMESQHGKVYYGAVDSILEWTEKNQIPLRGHNIFWGIPNFVPGWQKSLSNDDLREVVKQRALDVGKRYRGRFAEYDLNNEMIHGNFYADRLGSQITLHMAQWVREGDPNANLYLNDYDILTGVRLNDYVKHIRALLDQGVPIAGIGVQGHLHGESFDPQAVQNALDQLAQFKLPIRVTEFNMPGQRSRYYKDRSLKLTEAEEQAKAKNLADYYRICFAHPSVEGILMWGFWEGANWIPASSLYKRDWTPLPAAHAYRDLIFREWWTRWEGKADSQGKCTVPVFFGKHRIKVGEKEQVVTVKKSENSKIVVLK